MRKWKLALCLAFLSLLVASGTPAHAQLPSMPHSFWGNVTIDGSPAPTGTLISARVGGAEKGQITTTEVGKYGSASPLLPKLLVQGQILGGSQIDFFINGVRANETYPFTSGANTELNLTRGSTGGPTGGSPPASILSLDDPPTWFLAAVGIAALASYWFVARWRKRQRRTG